VPVQPNILAAQESQNATSPPPAAPTSAPAPLAYSPGATIQAAPPKPQDYLVVSIEPPDETQPAPQSQNTASASASAQTLTATVVAQTGSGQPLLATSEGALLVNQAVATTIGTEIVLQRLTPAQAAAQPAAAQIGQLQNQPVTAGPAPLNDVPLTIARSQPWPALTQLLSTLATAAPAASAYIRQAIPNPASATFAQAFTAFITAKSFPSSGPLPPPGALTVAMTPPGQASMRTADPQDFKATLLQLGADLTTSALKSSPPSPAAQPWQSYQVPILTDYGITMAQLFLRQQTDEVDDEAGKRSTAKSTRFLIEVSPSQLGPVQLDGLLRKMPTNTLRLDLIVRTEFVVPSRPAVEMADLFQGALGATGIVGGLSFQTGPENFVLPESDTQYSGKI
jgi:hypothetical protein